MSIASLWEIAIKVSVGKLTLAQPVGIFLAEQLHRNSMKILPISYSHLGTVASLPLHHRDPFDRMIVAQSLADGLTVLSNEHIFDLYGAQRIW